LASNVLFPTLVRMCGSVLDPERKDPTMRDITDSPNIDRRDVGETNSPAAERTSGVGGWLGVGLGIWTVVILVAIAFIAAILVFAF
jgi:hypothetical protein